MAFHGCSGLTSITISNSVTTIELEVFSMCTSLTSINIPNSVTTIEFEAFYGCTNLTYITIPNSVTTIGERAFYNTLWYNNLPNGIVYINNVLYAYKGTMPQGTNLIIKEGTTAIGAYAFQHCQGLASIIIPNSLTTIEAGAFRDCSGLTSIAIPNSVISIGWNAFDGCTGLTSITIPNSVTSIGDFAFRGILNVVYFGTATGSPWEAKAVNGYVDGCFVYSDATKTALLGCSSKATGTITIPNSVTSIETKAFYECTNLTSVTIPNSVTNIGERAFEDCHGLTSITIPNSVTTIGKAAFQDCTMLTSVTIPNSVTNIGTYAFSNTPWDDNLPDGVVYIGNILYAYKGTMPQGTSLIIKEGTTSISGGAFKDCSGLTSIAIPNSVTNIGESAFEYCYGLTSITIPNSVTTISEATFQGCYGLTSVTIPNSVTTMEKDAFFYCYGLTSVTIPNSITIIEDEAFAYCYGLTSVTIPNSITTVNRATFAYCSGLISVTIPNSVISIEDYAFSSCSNLTSITIPNSVTSIGGDAFTSCFALSSVICQAVEPPATMHIDNEYYDVFSNVSSIPLYVPIESIDKYAAAEVWKDFKEIKAINATPIEADEPVLAPEENRVAITWPAADNAVAYTIEIHQIDLLICTLTFDADGVLQSMRFAAPARHTAQTSAQAEATGNGFRFVVDGLDCATTYTYNITATDIDDAVLTAYTGTFTTTDPATDIENIRSTQWQSEPRKVFRNGQVYILRNDKMYNINGTEM